MPDLLQIMARLRAPDGCPWDKEQTHASLLSCLIEESFEFIDAVEKGDLANMAEELGDILLQVIFHSQMAKESGHFTFEDVAHGIAEKLIRRHPHVFGEAKADSSAAVITQWDDIKAQEKAAKAPPPEAEGGLGQIPRQLPALPKAEKIQKRAAKHGFDWQDWQGPLAKVHEELAEFEIELKQLLAEGGLNPGTHSASRAMAGEHPTPEASRERLQAEFGDMLFAMVNLGRHLEIDSERALSQANRKFMRRFAAMENLAKADGHALKSLSLSGLDAYWDKVKAAENPTEKM